ncbi:hypothetical protein ABE607_16105 [Comamonas aquatica]|uniref:hypothetical protein n=1 Tax=Comamonas aquatica TaxID=225991 RepID=UPI00320B57D2
MSAATVLKEVDKSMNLHDLYQRNTACGYRDDLTFSASEVQSIAARLRGATAISALMIATINREEFAVSEYIQSGLVEAMHVLTSDVQSSLERRNSTTQKAKEAACMSA